MPRARAVTVDEYSYLSHKALVGHPDQDPGVGAPTWCPPSERRRIRAQLARAAYLGGVARDLLPADVTDKARDAHREYGDPATFVRRIVAAVLGDDWTWIVDGADEDLPDEPDLPPEPEDADEVEDEDEGPGAALRRRIAETRRARWLAEAEEIVDQWEADWAAQPMLQTRQAEYRAWADRANIALTIHAAERYTVGIGQSAIILWHQDGDWPRPEVIPPEAVFPVRDEHDDGKFPRKYHFAWEYDHDRRDTTGAVVTERRLRRITFELVDIASIRSADGQWVDADGQPTDGVMLRGDEQLVLDDGTAHIVRTYPWDRPDPDGDTTPALTETAGDREPSRTVCLYSDGTWPLEDLGHDVYALDESKATWRPYGDGLAYRADYGIDFLPLLDTTGESIIDVIAQVLDDLAGADTAVASASRYLAHPTVALEGAGLPEGQAPVMMPGRILTGKLTPLDLSQGLPVLMDNRESLRDRATSNVGIPADLLGRVVDDGGPESGISRLIRWAPFAQLVGELRMNRKYDLFAKMAQRMAQVQGRMVDGAWVPVLPPGSTPAIRLAWGSFLPMDRSQALKDAAEGVRAHVMSLQSAVAWLVAAGFPIDDARAEVERIRADDTESAVQVADATGSERLAADRLGLVLDDAGPPPVIDLPPAPGASGGSA